MDPLLRPVLVAFDCVYVLQRAHPPLLPQPLHLQQKIPHVLLRPLIGRRLAVGQRQVDILRREVSVNQLDQMPHAPLMVQPLLPLRRHVRLFRPPQESLRAPPENRIHFRLQPRPGYGRPGPVSHLANPQHIPDTLVLVSHPVHPVPLLRIRFQFNVEQRLILPAHSRPPAPPPGEALPPSPVPSRDHRHPFRG